MKGFSERVKNKNISIFGNKPLFFHVADTLLSANVFSELIINTDDSNISKMALDRYGEWVNINERPKQICGDFVSMNEIIKNDLSRVDGEFFFQTHSTNPLIKKDTIISAVEFFFDSISKYDSIFSVNKLQIRLFNSKIKPINHNIEKLMRTQDLAPVFEENSNFYIFSRSSFHKTGMRIGKKPCFFEMNKLESIDIDDKVDYYIAEAIYEKNKKIKS